MTREVLQSCHAQITPFIHRTPLLTSRLLDEMAGCQIFFKCENFQKMGAFKMRGAMNAVLNLNKDQLEKGVVTHSSGNFAQAVSLAAKFKNINAFIVMPSNAPKVKVEAVKGYGGKVIISGPNIRDREEVADKVVEETGATLLHPSNDLDVIIGQGTAAMELLKDYPDLSYMITPVGGGGLLAGTALAVHHFGDNCVTIGAEPEVVDDAYRSLLSGKIEYNESTNTIADGLRTNLGDVNFPIIQKHVDKIITVSEEEIIQAMRHIWERMKIIVEPSSATAFAALLKSRAEFKGKKVGIVISGGNVDLNNLPF